MVPVLTATTAAMWANRQARSLRLPVPASETAGQSGCSRKKAVTRVASPVRRETDPETALGQATDERVPMGGGPLLEPGLTALKATCAGRRSAPADPSRRPAPAGRRLLSSAAAAIAVGARPSGRGKECGPRPENFPLHAVGRCAGPCGCSPRPGTGPGVAKPTVLPAPERLHNSAPRRAHWLLSTSRSSRWARSHALMAGTCRTPKAPLCPGRARGPQPGHWRAT